MLRNHLVDTISLLKGNSTMTQSSYPEEARRPTNPPDITMFCLINSVAASLVLWVSGAALFAPFLIFSVLFTSFSTLFRSAHSHCDWQSEEEEIYHLLQFSAFQNKTPAHWPVTPPFSIWMALSVFLQ